MRKCLFGFVLLLGTLAAAPAAVANPTDIPFSFQNGVLVVEAKIKDDVPVYVVIATGSEYSVVDVSQVKRYDLAVGFAPDSPVTGRNDSTYSFSKVSKVRISDGKAKDLAMRLGSMGQLSQASGREIFAALGADFFEGQTVQFDFKNKVLRFLEKSAVDALKDKSSGGANKILLQMEEKESNPFLKTFRIPLVSGVTFDGKKSKLLLDTGRATHLAFSSSAAKNVGFTPPAENGPPREDRIKSLRLGEYEMSDLPVLLLSKGTNVEKSISKYGVVAGSNFLQGFIATFDFRSGLVVLERS